MADQPSETQASSGPERSSFVIMGIVVVAALLCLSFVAALSLFILSREPKSSASAPVQNVTVNNNAPAVSAPSASAQATPSGPTRVLKGFDSVVPNNNPLAVKVLVRAVPIPGDLGTHPLPNRLSTGLAHRGEPAGSAAALAQQTGAVIQGQAGGLEVSDLPDVEYLPGQQEGSFLRVQIQHLVKTSRLEPYVALKGFQFLVADLHAVNTSSQTLHLSAESLEVDDQDGLGYLVNPDLTGGGFPSNALKAGEEATWRSAFLVPADASLGQLSAGADKGKPVRIPLHPK